MAVAPMPMPWRRLPVGVVGLGLIGGSIALDLRRRGMPVHGLVHRDATATRAMERQLVDRVSTDPAVLQGCGLVVLALPLDRLLEPEPNLLAALPPQAVVTDVGSVKQPVLELWQGLHPRFVPSHPMAGTADAGVDAGQGDLFEGRPWVATPGARTEAAAVASVRDLATLLGANWLCCPAADHDQAVALISHLPVLVSAALLQAADRAGNAGAAGLSSLVRALASSGFADTTRVGGGNPQLGALMARNNRSALLPALQGYRDSLFELEQLVQQADWPALQARLECTKQLRGEFVAPDRLAGAG